MRDDGKHEVVTLMQRVDLADRVSVARGKDGGVRVTGFADDTIVRRALEALAAAAGVPPAWSVHVDKRIPVAAGLGGGSSDAATALRLANESLAGPLARDELERLAATVGADVPFFLHDGPQLATGDGTRLRPAAVPQDFWVVLLVPDGAVKASTASVYRAFDERGGERGFEQRSESLLAAIRSLRSVSGLASLPANDLASSPLTATMTRLGAFRSDVSGAGPAVYGLFLEREHALAARRELRALGRVWAGPPVWYG